MKTILFQGDSITDAGRDRERQVNLGLGYPNFVGGHLGLKYPGAYTFINRGISGNRVVDLYARIKVDLINLKPDFLSVLLGVNDVWHEKKYNNGISADKFKKVYKLILEESLEALPELKIMLIEPFVLGGPATEDSIAWFREEVGLRAQVVNELAEEFQLPFIQLQADLDKLSKVAPSTYWLEDGVHPTVYFHQYLANKWIEAFDEICG